MKAPWSPGVLARPAGPGRARLQNVELEVSHNYVE